MKIKTATFFLTLTSLFSSLPVLAEDYQFIKPEILENNPHTYCTPIVGQSMINGVFVTQIVGHDCQSYIGGAFQLEAVKEQEETKRKQIEVNGKLTLIQLLIPRQF